MKTKPAPQTHTPTPWQQGTSANRRAMDTIFTDKGQVQICRVDTSCPEDGENEANAAFIVKACNAHDELVKTLEWVSQKLWDKLDHSEILNIKGQIAKAIAAAEGSI